MVTIMLQEVVPLAVLLVLSVFFSFFKQKKLKDVPKGTMGWPLIGETLAFLKPHKSNSVGTFLEQHCSRYGRVFKSHLFGYPTVVSCDLELNIFILQNEGKLFQSSFPKPVLGILGKLSLMLVSGDLHKRLRTVALSFTNASKSSPVFLHYVEKSAVSVMKSWKERCQVHFFKETRKFTLHLMLKNLLNIEPEEPRAFEIFQDFLTFMKGFVSFPLYIPGTPYAKAIKARARISSTIKDIIEEREKRGVGALDGDFLDEIMIKFKLSNEERISIVMDLLLAGYETTSGLLSLVVYFLAQSPSFLEKLKEEQMAVKSSKKDGEHLNWEDFKQMEFTSNVISEALRCGNLVKFMHRRALQDVKFKGYLIPAGWRVLPIFTATHLDPSLHENPLDFNPNRWNDESVSKKVTPFGGGLRYCIGADLARVEVALFLHHFVLNYRWKIQEDDFPISRPYLDFNRGLLLEIEPIIADKNSLN